jgi:hypothetical protein
MTKPPSGTTKAERAITLALSLGLRQLPEPLFMLKAISRTEVVRTGVMLRLRRVPATPQERASARLDARMDWRLKFGVSAILIHPRTLIINTLSIAPGIRHASAGASHVRRANIFHRRTHAAQAQVYR